MAQQQKAALHVVNGRGEFVRGVTVRADAGAVCAQLEPYKPNVVAGVESTTGADDLADELRKVGIECRIGDPKQLRYLNRNRRKSDRRDAECIALVLRADLFPSIYHAPKDVRELRELLRWRCRLVEQRQAVRARTTLRNPCRHGLPSVRATEKPETGHQSHLSPAALIAVCERAVDDALTAPIDELERGAVQVAEQLFPTVFPRLDAISGVGPLTAAILCAEFGDIHRFPKPDNLLSYARLVTPSDQSSGKIVRRDNPNAGNKHLHRAFLDAAKQTTRHCPLAGAWFNRRFPAASQHGAGLMAVARNLAEAVYIVWKKGVDYDPGRAFPEVREGRAM